MAANFKIVSPSDMLVFKTTDWTLCFLCQGEKNDNLITPSKKLGYIPDRSSYITTANLLMEWKQIEGIDRSLFYRLSGYTTNDELSSHFINNDATFHKKCLCRYDRQKLKRKQVDDKPSKLDGRLKKSKVTRRSIQTSNFTAACFFCEGKDNLLHCRSLELDQNVRKIANKLEDSKLLAKLAEGDMCATEAVYHKKCITEYYNKYKQKSKQCHLDSSDIKGIALSAVIQWLKDSLIVCLDDDKIPVYPQKDIVNMYREKLREYGAIDDVISSVHCTRLIDKLLACVPGIIATQSAQDNGRVVLTLDGELGKALFQACIHSSSDDMLVIADAARRIRKVLFSDNQPFNGDTSFECQKSSVPDVLIRLINLILEGGNPDRELNASQTTIACNIAQLIKFNTVKQTRKETTINFRHSKDNEPPLPVIVGLQIHSKTRKKSLIKVLSAQGLSICYERVMTIRSSIAQKISKEYNDYGFVFPSQLQKSTFTTSAIDNFDYNLTSATASTSVHWTGISIFQHPERDFENIPFRFDSHCTSVCKLTLPPSYTEIKPMLGGRPEPIINTDQNIEYVSIMEKASDWITALKFGDFAGRVSFASFYSRNITKVPRRDVCILLPLITESINSHAVVAHTMEQIRKITNLINPGQCPVITADQPVYALCKQVQLMTQVPFFCKMGDLHTEMAFLSVIGDWLEGSGWTDIYGKSNISTPGRVQNFLSGSKVKRTRYAFQVSLRVLLQLALDAFNNSSTTVYDEWINERKVNSTTAFYWFTAIELITTLFMFVRSVRASNFSDYVSILQTMMPWFFSLDHINYSRWMTVYVNDLISLTEDSELYQEFNKGKFTVNKTGNTFSAMGEDQAHEQHNKVIKEDGGGVGLFDNAHAILEWSLTVPYVAQILDSQIFPINGDRSHHEDNDNFENKFISDCTALHRAWLSYGNPFEEVNAGLIHATSKRILPENAEQSVRNAFEMGKKQYEKFTKSRSSLHETISKNKLALFRQKNAVTLTKIKQKMITLQERSNIFKDFYISCQTRQGNLDEFFSHMNHDFPPSLSEYGKLRHPSSKSDILECIKSTTSVQCERFIPPNVDATVIDGPAWVHMHPPRSSKTFEMYCSDELLSPVVNSNVKRVDIIFDAYHPDSLKRDERIRRGQENRYAITKETAVPRNFQAFLCNDANKTDLFRMISKVVSGNKECDMTLVSTKDVDVVSNKDINVDNLSICLQEEADTRMFVHVNDILNEFPKIKIVTVDSDVVVIGLSLYYDLKKGKNLEELWVEFGVGKDKKWIPIHTYAESLGENMCRALPFFHALTGSDTTSQFAGRGKKTAWKTWQLLPECTETFIRMSTLNELTEIDKCTIERFVCVMYDRGSSYSSVNDSRRYLFTKLSRSIENCPPTSNVLEQHIKRAQLQSSIWSCSLILPGVLTEPNEWGWQKKEGYFEPLWSTIPKVSDACLELKRCKCKKKCTALCTCRKNGLVCTDLCLCSGQCSKL